MYAGGGRSLAKFGSVWPWLHGGDFKFAWHVAKFELRSLWPWAGRGLFGGLFASF